MVADGTTYRLISDHLGSVRLVVDATTGVVAQRLDYDEFGKVTLDTSPGLQPFGFAGGLYDADTELVRFGFRDYDPETGRWTAKDPILFAGGQANLYLYVGVDPVNNVDANGLVLPLAAGAAGLAAAVGAAAAATVVAGTAILATVALVDVLDDLISESRIGGSDKPITPTVKHPTRKKAKDAAQADSARGKPPIHHPKKGDKPPHFHPSDPKGCPKPKHHDYPTR
jgi:RHS repeat-associated protein